MNQTNTGGAAFPDPGRAQSAKQREHLTETGMTLRDYFAAAAMRAVISVEYAGQFTPEAWADHAYQMADAMLAERAK